MADEVKQEEKQNGKKMLSTLFKVLLGLAFIVVAVYLMFFFKAQWWHYTWIVIKGSIGPFLILAGVITLAIAKE